MALPLDPVALFEVVVAHCLPFRIGLFDVTLLSALNTGFSKRALRRRDQFGHDLEV